MGEWQPIETAPTNGTEFLAAIFVTNDRGGSWWERHVVAIDDETGAITDGLYMGWDRGDYSHWHALPAPPLPAQHVER